LSEPACNWYALFVRSHHEFVTTEQLQKQGIEAFLPSVKRVRRWSDREKTVTYPLFPGYVFVHISPSAEMFLRVVKTHGTVSFVSQEPGHPTPVDPVEMHALRLMMARNGEIDIYPYLCEGASVVIRRGPLQGASGVLAKKGDDNLFLVNVEILGRCVGLKINADELDSN
jgi:transcriptional antiterminator NusG